ncbi:Hpt domain-containing protein [Massilia agilis]|uniref:Hpt domain-containing protein n=1 Tax=Massilia agilis TaxID=1811226 RepID=A0ABT2DHL4_9BURK|nr:Hpt domain-containing protein [Massilia agilis]
MSLTYRLIDPAVLLDAAGNDQEGFIELLALFVRVAPDGLRQLQLAIDAASHRDIAHHAHSLKSCLSLVGAHGPAGRLEQLERAARAGQDLPGAGFTIVYEELIEVIAEALACRISASQPAWAITEIETPTLEIWSEQHGRKNECRK